MRQIACKFLGHERDGARVWDDGYNYRAPCRRCGAPMIKATLGDWRIFDSARDFEIEGHPRKARPSSR